MECDATETTNRSPGRQPIFLFKINIELDCFQSACHPIWPHSYRIRTEKLETILRQLIECTALLICCITNLIPSSARCHAINFRSWRFIPVRTLRTHSKLQMTISTNLDLEFFSLGPLNQDAVSISRTQNDRSLMARPSNNVYLHAVYA